METGVYRNTGANVPPVNNFSTTNPHPLQLFPEDRITIHEIFLRHLAHCNLTPRRVRIVLTVFNQTLGFNKFEDDMNGPRLEQLTGIASNHANETVRELQQLHVLVTRRGKYGNFLAINFDFAQWGQAYDEQYTPNIDPCFLLPKDAVSDVGLDLSGDVTVDTNDDIAAIGDNLDVPINVHHEKAEQPAVEQATQPATSLDTDVLKELLKAIQTLTEKVAKLEQKIDTPPAPQQAITPVIIAPEKPKTVAKNSTNENTQIAPTLRYPRSFNPQQCQQAATIIQQAHDSDKAQMLLDMLAKRINNQHDPLRNPIRYLETLVEKLNNNQLSIKSPNEQGQPSKPFVSTTTSITGEATPEPSKAEQIKAEYQEATLDCRQMQRNINMLAEQDNISFEASLVKLDLTPWWEQAKERFYKAKEAFVLLMEEQDEVMV